MTSIVKLQAFSGAHNESPPCYMLQVDEFRFLLDCGWDEDFNLDFIKELKRHTHQIDAVLLSYPDHIHLGALPYMVGKAGMTCPIYATIPVYKMGQMFMYDLYQSRHNTEDFEIFSLDDVDCAFDKIHQLKYSQTVHMKGKGHGLQITPLPAGHMIGGTIWKIVKDGEEEIIYAADYNHKKERHLNGCVLESISRPSLMITDAFNATYIQSRRRTRDEQLMTTILQTMRNDGNVLVAVDTAGRMLELAQLLDQMWRTSESGLSPYSLALLNNVSFNVVEFAKSQMEWMSDKIMRSFEENRNNPFHFKHVKLCHNLAELSRIPEPKVVLSSVPDLQCGFSRDLFVAWCGSAKNSIILTNRTSPGTLARQLIDNPENKTVTMEIRRRIKLEGGELDDYLKKKQEKVAEMARVKNEQENDLDDESSDESEAEMDIDTYASGTKGKHDLMMKSEGKSRTGFFKQAKKAYPMFPYTEEKIKWDEYGEIIRPEDYTILEAPIQDEVTAMDSVAREVESMQEVSEVPTKCVSATVTLDINANIQYIDFEGRSDGESIKKILSQIKPRQLILVRAVTEATDSLADYCRKLEGMVQGKIFTPKVGEIVDVTRESHIYQVRLRDYVVSALDFQKAKDTELAWLEGMLDMSQGKTDTSPMFELEEGDLSEEAREKRLQQEKMDEEEKAMEIVPTLESVQPHQIEGHKAVFVNEPKLSDFKLVLLQEGFQAEFIAGVLICNSSVAVKRNEAGKIQLEGSICEDFYKIRELLYNQYAIV
ncbi:cleavage and polyadenylation specificity factor subunit 2-like [Mizuhopecten yessoensis]|uniref:cleavage and polyadenylation specificity factor subunit 2-like n=1 Tax=Mizuhopecten yessoensis TaxID=6573 RepID=UPI000B45B0FB|nr:cleavage and polyadenylation specificity factor subunit 2-like [Mizuhopecten yessoensis]